MASVTSRPDRQMARPPHVKQQRAWKDKLPAILASLGAIGLWWVIIIVFGVKQYVAPTPLDVVLVFVDQWDLLLRNLQPTLLESLAGFLLGNTVAILIAVTFVYSRNAERAFYPLAVFVNTIPIIAIAPILVLILGNGYAPKIVIAALICFFPTLVNVTRGLKSVPPAMIELMRVLSASELEVLLKVRAQCCLPFLFAALKIASTTSVIGAIVGEWIGSNFGLGALIIEATYNFRSPQLYATVFLAALLAVLMFSLISFVERRVINWKVDASA